MSGFNTSSRSGDMSMKLRAQNMRNARDQTKRLEEDNRKMEERLRELKTVMTREKEERERQGGGFWGRGQSQAGSLTKYADEVLHSKPERPPKEGKKKKIKVLQDEPIEVPKRPAQPGTMKYIAQRKLPAGPGPVPQPKQKGPRCGQCEDRAATLSCVQCSEIYCPGCFAAFHVKGALKHHRSVPISASGPRVCMSPHPSVDPQPSPRGSQASGSIVSHSTSHGEGSGASSARQPPMSQVGAAPTAAGGSLLEGSYDESQSAASFQAALMAWRDGPSSNSPSSNSSSSGSPNKDRKVSPQRRPIASPVKSPVIAVDESTGTNQETRVPEIKFTSTLSYAERLLLKGHRRTELAETATPRLSSQSPPRSGAGDQSQRLMSSQGPVGYHGDGSRDRWGRPTSSRSSSSFSRRDVYRSDGGNSQSQREDTFIDDGDRVDFQSLFEAVTASESPEQASPQRSQSTTSSISITEIRSNFPTEVPRFKSSSTYVVEEARPMEAWKIQQRQVSSTTFVKEQPASFAPSKSSLMNKQPSSQNNIVDMFAANESDSLRPANINPSYNVEASLKTAQRRRQHQEEPQQREEDGETPRYASPTKYPDSQSSSSGSRKTSERSHISAWDPESASAAEKDIKSETPRAGERNKSSSRPKSGMSSRPKSSMQSSRPGSRAQSRAASRMKVEGVLTKGPSSALSEVARMAQSTEHTYTYQSPLEDFFLAGVEEQQPPIPEEGRVLTPSKGRKPTSAGSARPKSRVDSAAGSREEKYKISYKLYKMAPKSWRPDSSLGEVVPLSEVKVDEPQEDMVMAYTYSGQLTGQATEWRPTSSLSGMPSPPDELGLVGDEMFTEDASAAAASLGRAPSAAATPTPRAYSRDGSKSQSLHHAVSRHSKDTAADEGDITPTPSRAARRKSANRRSFTPLENDNPDSDYNRLGGGDTATATGESFQVQNSSEVVRKSASLRRSLGSTSRSHSRGVSSPLPTSAMTPTPPSQPPRSSHTEATRPSSSSSTANTEPPRSAGTSSSVRAAQLSRRGFQPSARHHTNPSPSQESSATPTTSHRLPLSSTRDEQRTREGTPEPVAPSASARSARHSRDDATGSDRLPSRSRPGASKPSTPLSLSRQGTNSSSSGLARHASDVEARPQPRSFQQDSQFNARPASNSGAVQRNRTAAQQWRPNSSTGGGEALMKAGSSVSASMEGRTKSHLHEDTVISDMLQSRVQADGWMDGGEDDGEADDDDDDDYEGFDDNDNDDGYRAGEEDVVGMSHNYDDGNELNLMSLLPKRANRSRAGDGKMGLVSSSQHWETEVRPFSGRSSMASARPPADGEHSSRAAGEKAVSRLRPGSSRPVSSLSRASGRESRAIAISNGD